MPIADLACTIIYDAVAHGDLKPCPFCGSTDLEVNNTHTPSYWVECNNCEGEISGEYPADDTFINEEAHTAMHETAIRSAVRWWNTRDVSSIDTLIIFWRHVHNHGAGPKGESVKAELRVLAPVYIDAYQCARVNLCGDILP